MSRRPFLVLAAASLVAASGVAAGCGTEKNDVKQPGATIKGVPQQYETGAKLFVERCSGCHNLDLVGAEGGATSVQNRERPDGPNFNVRRETRDGVLYALRNGGFSGAIMPQDIVVGRDAQAVAAFLAKYAGHKGTNEADTTSGAD